MSKRNGKKFKKKKIILLVILVLVILGGIGFYGYKKGWFTKEVEKIVKPKKKEVKHNLKIFDLNSNARPYAVMIDNVKAARPQYGLSKAYMVYEIIVEGGLTRMMAVFKDVDVDQIGPVRSSRHYFLDYAMENDAIYVHYGWSPNAQADISSFHINNLNGLENPAKMFWRNSKLHKAPHNAYTSTKNIQAAAEKKGYGQTSDDYMILNYSYDEFDLSTKYTETTSSANEVKMVYSKSVNTSYNYDAESKLYKKFENGVEHKDAATDMQLSAKNILILEGIRNYNIDSYGRQNIENVGSGTGYYLTNGQSIKIKWEKESRKSKTIYKDENGKILKVNDGNTFVHLIPTTGSVSIA